MDIDVRSTDGRDHAVSVYYDWSANWSVGEAETELSWGRHRAGPVEALFVGAAEQRPLKRSGDEVQIEWGYLFVSSQPDFVVASAFGDSTTLLEESGNMLILAGALAQRTGSTALAEEFWSEIATWAQYLLDSGLDPENQLCTDDFAGHMPHNANLAIKAILGIGAFGQLCEKLGKMDEARHYLATAKAWATQWRELADDGAGYRLAFDQPGTWSQKYNLVWDRILGLDLFDGRIADTEMALYRGKLNAYGLPLDSRKAYTKLDWLVWSACLTGKQDDFNAILAPLADWLDAAPQRVPLSDWFQTDTGKQPNGHGFWARSVVGGVFIKLMIDTRRREVG
ncbi:DUF1793 domain-containing protein [Devosia sp. FKR38]|uniref:glutaminase domain-containing protein n=1 Tax=Devosia sp. FKR38 TaxID=2562312 RepID=UPI0010BFB735|nr:DUF1793 domain-containing protein [Devosia sp. FKR38]